MGYPANAIPLHGAGADSYDPDALRLGPDDIPATKIDTGTHAKRKAARDRLFIPSMAWPELAAVVAAGMSGRAVGLWLAIRMQAKLERTDWVRVRDAPARELGLHQPRRPFPRGGGAGAGRADRGAAAEGLRPAGSAGAKASWRWSWGDG